MLRKVMRLQAVCIGLIASMVPYNILGQTPLFYRIVSSPNGDIEIEDVIPTSDNHLLLAGYGAFSAQGDGDAYVLKAAPDGQIVWQKTYGGPDEDMAISLKETPDGYLVGGWTRSFGAGGYDFWLLKLNPDGQIVWQKTYGKGRHEQIWSVDADASGYLLVGGSNSSGIGRTDVWVIKTDPNGNIIWQKKYGTSAHDAPPGDFDEFVARGFIDAAGRYVIAGLNNKIGHGGYDIWLARLNPTDGAILWDFAYGDAEDETYWNIAPAGDGAGYYIAGNTTDPNTGEGDLWVVKVDTLGQIIWQNRYGLPNVWDEALNLHSPADGGLLVGAYVENSSQDWAASVLALDRDGTLQWAKQYKKGAMDWTNALTTTPWGTTAIVGVSAALNPWKASLFLVNAGADGSVGSCSHISPLSLTPTATQTTAQDITLSTRATNVTPQTSTASATAVAASNTLLCSHTASALPPTPLAAGPEAGVNENSLTVRVPADWKGARLTVRDLRGRILIQRVLDQPFLAIDISAWPRGAYLIGITHAAFPPRTERVIRP